MATFYAGDPGWVGAVEYGFEFRLNGHLSSEDARCLAQWLNDWAEGNPIAAAIEDDVNPHG